jgi:hypothetical protein
MLRENSPIPQLIEQVTCHHSDTDQSFNGDSDISSEWGYGPEEEDYDSYEETCQNNMRDIDDLMREWAD